ncbi:MAG: family 10 glycosylhydrolase [Porphyromonadaceae bacterium]|nr:family 10 glycosylhydrolase [Porphyromonadaceae bacterium]
MRRFALLLLLFLLFVGKGVPAQERPKRELRGVWLSTAYQIQYATMDSTAMRGYFEALLDTLQRTGINAVFFQVRPEADAFYPSTLEPWSRFLTGTQGKAPAEAGWDPLACLLAQCHERNMEFHAWINPYRAQCNRTFPLTSSHVYYRHPDWFITYGNQLFFDPGNPDCRAFIGQVVDDIVRRYDVDGIHLDDYFYPYPIEGTAFADSLSYARYGGQHPIDDWRRENVNQLIADLSQRIKAVKPWVRFGVSPFGIYRNCSSDPDGSDTHGLQDYDDLYADVLAWVEHGWVDYLIPQLYWEIGHSAADYVELAYWWNRRIGGRCLLYLGEDVTRSLDVVGSGSRTQLGLKIALARYLDHVSGLCFWSGYSLWENYKGVRELLQREFFSLPALIPAYASEAPLPPEVKKLRARWSAAGYRLEWQAGKSRDPRNRPAYYCVYRFAEGEEADLERAEALAATVRELGYLLPYRDGKGHYRYAVTAVDRLHRESAPQWVKVNL